ncbi:MAG TPA: exodeoxyribonuclease VII large subunit [Roseomonas sp.]|nr:exodeoxyribonuclease VII large subunit [Roseomonas sp.]
MPAAKTSTARFQEDSSERNDAVSLRGYLNQAKQVLQSVPAHWVRCEVQEIKENPGRAEGEFWANITVVETRDGKVIARAEVSAAPAAWRKIKAELADAGVELAQGSKAMLKLRPTLTGLDRLGSMLLEVDPTFLRGELALKAERIRQAIKGRGWWDLQRSLPVPVWFERVAVIAPRQAAGLNDVMVDARRLASAGVEFYEFHATFQSNAAPSEIIAALKLAGEVHRERRLCAILLVRGGGSSSDFTHLCDERLAAFVARLSVPVFTGIGHEHDVCILDEIAHRNCGTPSKAIHHIGRTMLVTANGAAEVIGSISRAAEEAERAASARVQLAMANLLRVAEAAPMAAFGRVSSMRDAVRHSATAAVDEAALGARDVSASVREIAGATAAGTASKLSGLRATLVPNALNLTDRAAPIIAARLADARGAAAAAVQSASGDLAVIRGWVAWGFEEAADVAEQRLAERSSERVAFASKGIRDAELAMAEMRPAIVSTAAEAASGAAAWVVRSRGAVATNAQSALARAQLRLQQDMATLRETVARTLEIPASDIRVRHAELTRAPAVLLGEAARRLSEARERAMAGATEAARRTEAGARRTLETLHDRAAQALIGPTAAIRSCHTEIARAPEVLLGAATKRVAEEKGNAATGAAEAVRRAEGGVRRAAGALREEVLHALEHPASDVRLLRAEIKHTPGALIAAATWRVAEARGRGLSGAAETVRRAETAVRNFAEDARRADPRLVMRSGYAVLRDPATGQSIRSVDQARALARVMAELHDGTLPLVPQTPSGE